MISYDQLLLSTFWTRATCLEQQQVQQVHQLVLQQRRSFHYFRSFYSKLNNRFEDG